MEEEADELKKELLSKKERKLGDWKILSLSMLQKTRKLVLKRTLMVYLNNDLKDLEWNSWAPSAISAEARYRDRVIPEETPPAGSKEDQKKKKKKEVGGQNKGRLLDFWDCIGPCGTIDLFCYKHALSFKRREWPQRLSRNQNCHSHHRLRGQNWFFLFQRVGPPGCPHGASGAGL